MYFFAPIMAFFRVLFSCCSILHNLSDGLSLRARSFSVLFHMLGNIVAAIKQGDTSYSVF